MTTRASPLSSPPRFRSGSSRLVRWKVSEIVGAPVDLEAVPGQGHLFPWIEDVLQNARVVDQDVQSSLMAFPVPRCKIADADAVAQVQRVDRDMVLVDAVLAQVVLHGLFRLRDMPPTGGDDRCAPTCKDPSGFIAEGMGACAGHDDVPAGHVDSFRHRLRGEKAPHVPGGLGECVWHVWRKGQRVLRGFAAKVWPASHGRDPFSGPMRPARRISLASGAGACPCPRPPLPRSTGGWRVRWRAFAWCFSVVRSLGHYSCRQ